MYDEIKKEKQPHTHVRTQIINQATINNQAANYVIKCMYASYL